LEVVIDCARANEQLPGDLPVRGPFCHKAGYVRLLWSQLIARLDGSLARALAGGRKLDACSLGERVHPEFGEHLVRRAAAARARRCGERGAAAIRRRADARGEF